MYFFFFVCMFNSFECLMSWTNDIKVYRLVRKFPIKYLIIQVGLNIIGKRLEGYGYDLLEQY
jgi:hypothetical protein